MTDKTTDSTQPDSTADTQGLTEVTPGENRDIRIEEIDRDDPPVADLARELPKGVKDANRLEGDWSGDGDVNHADDAQDAAAPFDESNSQ
ncbi:hypothetical protein [Pseudooctadecabacter jejudonensis]|uniref:Uncharacterized protein n=1 Tax=Pseudooctadecabacter jejudonensis TaxID=1391910 RepID=A0A1Y5S3K6_9RHOB|nr:hypothetical protein [Pseudooctadecabacter jejudonensis]SLN31562.1 hypothetical protein PSJ8397_01461 [Pseudooctadecabacter jejudonensis]